MFSMHRTIILNNRNKEQCSSIHFMGCTYADTKTQCRRIHHTLHLNPCLYVSHVHRHICKCLCVCCSNNACRLVEVHTHVQGLMVALTLSSAIPCVYCHIVGKLYSLGSSNCQVDCPYILFQYHGVRIQCE